MGKACKTCVFNTLTEKCKILHERIMNNCWAWADEAEMARREQDIKKYSGVLNGNVPASKKLSKEQIEKRTITRKKNAEIRGGKSVKEILDEKFNWYYQQGYTDEQIGQKLGIDYRRVKDYRRRYNLQAWNKKNRPVAAGTA